MKIVLSVSLHLCILGGGIAVAILSEGVVRWIGVIMAFLSFVTSIMTLIDINQLRKKSENAVYVGEILGSVPDVDTEILREQIKKDYPDLNP